MTEDETHQSEKDRIEDRIKSGANWFFCIAGLSLLNSILFIPTGKWNFSAGLGIAQLIDVIGLELINAIGNAGYIVVSLLNMIADGIFVFFGIFARKKCSRAFIAGLIVYGLDAGVFLAVQDYMEAGFHIFVLFLIAGGFKARLMLREDATFFAP